MSASVNTPVPRDPRNHHSRRSFLQLAGSGLPVVLAGCISQSTQAEDQPQTGTTTRTPTATPNQVGTRTDQQTDSTPTPTPSPDDEYLTITIELTNDDTVPHHVETTVTHNWDARCQYTDKTESGQCFIPNSHTVPVVDTYDVAAGETVIIQVPRWGTRIHGEIDIFVIAVHLSETNTEPIIKGIERGTDDLLDNPDEYAFRFTDTTAVTIHARITNDKQISLTAETRTVQ